MKKTYAAPAVVVNGDVVQETKSTPFGSAETIGQLQVAGSVGFHL